MSDTTKKLIPWSGCILLGIAFAVAAMTKWSYIAPLEKDVMAALSVQAEHPSMLFQILPRLLIAFELALGISLCQPYWRKRVILPLTIATLLFFSFYLISLDPTQENCGCFGAWLKMGPRASLIKNLVMLIIGGGAWWLSPSDPKGRTLIPAGIGLASILVTLAIIPLDITPPQPISERFAAISQFESTDKTLKEGIAVVAFFSATCEHCMEAAEQLAEMNTEGVNTFLMIQGDSDQEIAEFRQITGAGELPWKALDIETFFGFIGQAPPRIYLLNSGQEIRYWDKELDMPSLQMAIEELR